MPGENDNHDANRPLVDGEPDAHGQAAYLLVESLIFKLRANGILTNADAIEVVEVAAEVKREVGTEWGDTPATLRRSLALLGQLANSLRAD